MRGTSFAEKAALAAGSLAGLTTVGMLTEAAVVHVSGSPVSLSATAAATSVTWDVDGDAVGEFRLWNRNQFDSFFGNLQTVFVASNTVGGGRGNGRGLVAPFYSDDVQAVFGGELVGPSRSFGNKRSGYYQYRGALKVGSIGDDFSSGFVFGDNYVGFAFDSGAGLRYGYATFNFDPNGTLTIPEWWYDDSGASILVAPIPEPSGLALLAMGAAGIAAYRATRKPRSSEQAEETATS